MLKSKILKVLAAIGIIATITSAQTNAHWIKPMDRNLENDIRAVYQDYRNRFLRSTPSGNWYIEAGGTAYAGQLATISEAHGYGMIIFALMANTPMAVGDEQKIFDGMNQMRKGHPSSSDGAEHLMSWVVFKGHENNTNPNQTPINPSGGAPGRRSSATDGDLDMAYALLLAQRIWGGTYKEQALPIINQLRHICMGQNSKRVLLGDWARTQWGGNELNTRTSDWMPAHFRAFYRATEDRFWLEAIDTIYALLKQVSNDETGLMPDFATGRPARPDPIGGGGGENNTQHFANNAARVPWRLATDWAHHNTPAAKTQINRISAWLRDATNGNPNGTNDRIRHGYHLDGTPLTPNSWAPMHFLAPFAAGMIANPANQDYLNRLYNWIMERPSNDAYQSALQLLSMLLISGHWQAPFDGDWFDDCDDCKICDSNPCECPSIVGTWRNSLINQTIIFNSDGTGRFESDDTDRDFTYIVGNNGQIALYLQAGVLWISIFYEGGNTFLNGTVLFERVEESNSIHNVKRSNNRYGIRFAVNPVSDRAEISVVLPDMRATEAVAPTVVIYDMVGNVVFECRGDCPQSPAPRRGWEQSDHNNAIIWDLRNQNGRLVANGTYLIIAETKDRNGNVFRYSAKLGVRR